MSNFLRSVEKMKNRGGRINGEYYVDTAINDAISLGLRCVLFEIDYYICWGTPNDLRTFEYWQSCFNGWKSHPVNKQTHVVMSLVNPYEHLRKGLKDNNLSQVTEILLMSSRHLRKEYHVEDFERGSPDCVVNTDQEIDDSWDYLRTILQL